MPANRKKKSSPKAALQPESQAVPVPELAVPMQKTAPETGSTSGEEELAQEERRRKRLLLLLLILLLLLCCVCWLFYNYLKRPAPLPEIVPVVNLNYPPHYLFSIYGVDKPVGVAVSPDGERIYVAETGGDRLVKTFDHIGNPQFAFSPPATSPGMRSPVYLAVDSSGRVFVTDRLQNAIFVYTADGNYLDTILSTQLSLNQYVASQIGGMPGGTVFYYNVFEQKAHYTLSGQEDRTLPPPQVPAWDPLGVRFDPQGNLWLTDVGGEKHTVRKFATGDLAIWPTLFFAPAQIAFGATGQGNGEFLFPNVAVTDSQGRIYVTDGNNGRISAWDAQGNFLFEFGRGTGEGALSLPRGAFMDGRDRLHIVDAVGQNVKVYDVSGPQPAFLFVFGDWGLDDGLFNYPNDIALDQTGRLYIADRENNRIQVWSY